MEEENTKGEKKEEKEKEKERVKEKRPDPNAINLRCKY